MNSEFLVLRKELLEAIMTALRSCMERGGDTDCITKAELVTLERQFSELEIMDSDEFDNRH
tara:strand:- start:1660 stop:1842 length:183 start_codon:yes stop_codon:yes gene_type:complete